MKTNESSKILFLDLDGTLLNDDRLVSPGNMAAIQKALSHNHKIVIATGRPLVSARAFSEELGLTAEGCYVIAYNGGQIFDLHQKKSLFKKTIPMEYVRRIFDDAYADHLHCQTYDDTYILTEKDTPALHEYKKLTKVQTVIVDDITKALPEEPVKLIVMSFEHPEELISFRNRTAGWAAGKVDRFFSCPQYLEYVTPGVSKGAAIKILSRHLNIPMSDTIAVGDAENDITMLEAAAVGVVMKNAAPEMKKYGNYVTRHDNNHDGVAEIIEKFLL